MIDAALHARIEGEIARVDQLLRQKPQDKGRLYARHAPAFACISKDLAQSRYAFGTKVSVATTHRAGFIFSTRAMQGYPYDGDTLRRAREQVEILADTRLRRTFVDRGYRTQTVETADVCISGQRSDMTPALKRDLTRLSAIEPNNGQTKNDDRLDLARFKCGAPWQHGWRWYQDRNSRAAITGSGGWQPRKGLTGPVAIAADPDSPKSLPLLTINNLGAS